MRVLVQVNQVIVSIITLGLLACSNGFPTTHPDPAKNNTSTYKADVKDCAQSYPESPDGVYLRKRISCLELKGWK